jgi:hypothetical protein
LIMKDSERLSAMICGLGYQPRWSIDENLLLGSKLI